MTSCLKRLLLLIATAVLCLQPARAGAQAIAVEGDHFTVDRADGTGPHPKFLLFISYFDALRATDPVGDLDYIATTLRFDGIRVLPNWQRRTSAYCPASNSEPDTLFDAAGNIRGDTTPPSGPLKTLLDLIEAARARRLVVDVTFSRDTIAGLSWDDHLRAATRLSTLLKPYRNVLFDLDNEVQNHASPDADIRRMRDAILANVNPAVADPSRVVVVSQSGGTAGVVDYNELIGTSAIAYHDPRVSDWWDSQVPAVVAPLRLSGKPVYLQEPQAWNSGLLICGDQEPTGKDADGNAEHFRTAVARARASGAAAWTFHTRQSFRLNAGGSLRSRIQANGTEKNLLEGTETEQALSVVAATGVWPIDTTLSIDMLGTGDGTVTSSSGGINCGLAATACRAIFPVGTVVTLSSSAATGSEFAGWDGCAGTGTCTVTLDTSKTVGARFTAVQQIFYYDLDAIGSTRLITDSRGGVVNRYDYTPFGVDVSTTSGLSPRLFAGKQHDSETQFDYFGGRYLAPATGRFTTADPGHVNGELFDPQSWNAYAYVRNNPLNYVDLTGREYVICNKSGSCGTVSDQYFEILKKSPGASLSVDDDGMIWATIDGHRVAAGSYQQISVDPTFNSLINQSGNMADSWLRAGVREMAKNAAIAVFTAGLGFAVEGATAALEARAIAQAARAGAITEHAAQRMILRDISPGDINTAIQTAQQAGRVVTTLGKYGTPQKIYTGQNGIEVVVEFSGRNAGKVVTVYRLGQ